ncbi:hypothetical protein BC831DRAFT_496316 [Entophlyctis helioformis]|nr:hypothetical protein BC831DRAFT_496332 [Entophlyctis helioformis]KAI8904651.1 hypothetical protein BC831DRAFT_496316 [Entophlyctis helioformis]
MRSSVDAGIPASQITFPSRCISAMPPSPMPQQCSNLPSCFLPSCCLPSLSGPSKVAPFTSLPKIVTLEPKRTNPLSLPTAASPSPPTTMPPSSVQLLILGQGFIGAYVHALCDRLAISSVGTSTTGRAGTVPFVFDPASSDPAPFASLPSADTVLITFPLQGPQSPLTLTSLYRQTHPDRDTSFILLGSTRAWTPAAAGRGGASAPAADVWVDRHAPIDSSTDPRLQAEAALLSATTVRASVLNLSGLWGGQRQPRNWLARVGATKAALRDKGSVHLIHGHDVARVVVRMMDPSYFTPGERWIVTDLQVYDWWDLAMVWGVSTDAQTGKDTVLPQATWVEELMAETGVRGLPRDVGLLGRALDARDLWRRMGLTGPVYTLKTAPPPGTDLGV